MKVIYLSVITGLSICFAFSAQAGHGSQGLNRSRHQFHHQGGLGSKGLHRSGLQLHHQGQHHLGRGRNHTDGNLMKQGREGESAKPDSVPEEQRTKGADDTQTRSQEKAKQPNP
jgi:hypothetical protein